MASRRVAASAGIPLLRTSAPRAVRPFVVSAVAKRCCAARPIVSPRSSYPFRPAGVRWYSVNDIENVDEKEGEAHEEEASRIWSFEEVKRQVETNLGLSDEQKVVIVDVREPEELFETGRIPGAINIPITSAVQSFHIPKEHFEELYGFERPPYSAPLMFYCKAGVRARGAAGLAKHAGWKSVGEYPGSWLEWKERDGPVEKVEEPEDEYGPGTDKSVPRNLSFGDMLRKIRK